jgi:hypothetical protein
MPRDSLPVEYLFTLTAATSVAGIIASAPYGTRVIVDASTGSFEGPKLKGTVKGPGGDWLTMRADGTAQLDVRLLLETDDGALILMTYRGIFTDGGKHLRTAPQFETGDERYAWLNNVQAISVGGVTADGGGVEYEVYAVS